MTFASTFSQPFYTGTHSIASDIVPGKYMAALAGHPYNLDLASDQFRHRSIALMKPQQDTGNLPGEHSLNPEGVWRVSQDSWHKGAGQTYVDKPESDPARFRSSKGIYVWEKWQLSLLQDTVQRGISAELNQFLAVAGSRLYRTRGTALEFTTDITPASPTFTPVTGLPTTAPTSIASDGNNILTAHGADGIYRTTKALSVSSSYITGAINLIAYCKDRIMAANGPDIYNITTAYGSTAAKPAPLFTHRNADFTWIGFSEGQGYIYAAGYSGDKSVIYKTQVQPEGTNLTIPIIAGELPDGEIIRAIQGYLSYMLLGTDLGVRFCAVDDNGNLIIGSLIPYHSPVLAFEPQDKYVWFGMSNYDTVTSGLGRMDLTTFTSPLTPSYASDLMAATQGNVISIVTFQSRRVFTVSASGTFIEDVGNKVVIGTIDTGLFTFSTPDPKTALFLDVRYRALSGTHVAYLAKSDGIFVVLGEHSATTETNQFTVPQLRSDAFEIRHVLWRDLASPNTSPVITRHTLKATIALDPGYNIFAPLLLAEYEEIGSAPVYRDPVGELAYIKQLRADQNMVIWQEGNQSYQVLVDEYDWQPTHLTKHRTGFNGTCLVKLRSISGN